MDKQSIFKDIIDKVNTSNIASISSLLMHIVNLINSPNSTARELTAKIELDPPLMAKILKISNSVYYSSRSEITGLEKAIVWLGFNKVREIALNQKMVDIYKSKDKIENYSRELVWQHSVLVAMLNKEVHRKEFGDRGDNAYITGLLHQIGIIILDQFKEDEFIEVLSICNREDKNYSQVEKDVLGFTHGELGAEVLKSWNITEQVYMPITWHHNPFMSSRTYLKETILLYLVDTICQVKGSGFRDTPNVDGKLFEQCLARVKINFKTLESMFDEVKVTVDEMIAEGIL